MKRDRSLPRRSKALAPPKPGFAVYHFLVSLSLRPGMPDFQYVYILLSECGEHHYVGCTADLQQRLNKHNNGDVSHTSKFRPWRIQTAVAFRDVEKAAAFERYLKSHSGRSFASKHF